MIEISITTFFVLLSCILFLIVSLFLFPELFRYIKAKTIVRFYLGRILDTDEWEKKVKDVCQKWLVMTPTVRKTDTHTFWIIDFFKDNSKASIQVWQSASLYIALKEYYQLSGDESVNDSLSRFDATVCQRYDLKSIGDLDFGMLAFALLDKPEFDSFVKAMLQYVTIQKTNIGLIPYKANVKQTAFVDALGFICPFLTKYGVITDNIEYIELAKKQIQLYLDYGIEKNSGLPFHAFSTDTYIQRGICDWARGLAWLLIGLMDSYKVLEEAGVEDEFYRTQIKKYADILMKYQKENGGYTWQMLSGYVTDSSAIAVFGWYLACCSKLFAEKSYLEKAKKCRRFLMMQTRNNGMIDYCQGDTIGIGVYSRSFDIMPFAEGFALRMENEILSIQR